MPSKRLAVHHTVFPKGQMIIHVGGMPAPKVKCMKAEINQALKEKVNPDLLWNKQLLTLNRFKS